MIKINMYYEVSHHKVFWNAQEFDPGWNCRNICIEYNCSHDNGAGMALVFTNFA